MFYRLFYRSKPVLGASARRGIGVSVDRPDPRLGFENRQFTNAPEPVGVTAGVHNEGVDISISLR